MDKPKRNDEARDPLGMNAPIERRDLLNSTLLAAGAALLQCVAPFKLLAEEDWTGYGGVGDYSASNGNTYDVMTAGHQIRDGKFHLGSTDVTDTRETYDCVIVGGGISGLSGALFYSQSSP